MSKKYEYIAARGNGKSGMAARDIAKAVRAMENKEYIEKERALQLLEENASDDEVFFAARAIEAEPPADVAPVVRGEWIYKERHEHYPSGKPYTARYCGVCGKRLREVNNENKGTV